MPKYPSDSYQSKVLRALWKLMREYETAGGVKVFQQFEKVYWNARPTIPKSSIPCAFIWVQNVSCDPFGIGRQDLWNLTIRVMMYTETAEENDMDIHYLWAEALDRVCRENPRLSGDLSIQKTVMASSDYNFAFDNEFIMSETDATVMVTTKLCMGAKLS